jgi:phosphate transport system substrate-binding protein
VVGFRSLARLAGVAAIATSLTLPGLASAQDATPAPYNPGQDLSTLEGKIAADGSSTVFPIMEAIAEEFGNQASGVEVTVDVSGTGGGFKRFCAGETDLSNASRPIKDEEAAECAANGVSYYVFEIAYDGLSVVVNTDNDWIDCITTAQLNAIWAADSTITNWNQVDPSFPDQGLTLYGPGTDSGTYDYFTQQINGEEGVSRTDYNPSEDDNVLVQGVSGEKGALGFFGYSYYEQNQDSLKLLSVDNGSGCVAPSVETVQDGTYAPLSRPLYVYVKADALTRPEVQEFMRFAIPEVDALLTDVGFIGSPSQIYFDDQARVEQIIAGQGTPDGPNVDATPSA